MKILLTGASGLIGEYISRNYTSSKTLLLTPSKEDLDITLKEPVSKYFSCFKPDIVIHAAGATQILLGEKERGDKKGIFWQTNVIGSGNIISNCLEYKSYLIYISGEVVFAGRGKRPGPYKEDDMPEENNNYLSWYGQTKKEVERLIRQELPYWAIVRAGSVVGRGMQSRPDYIRKILLAHREKRLNPMFDDQFISLADNEELLNIIVKLMKKRIHGTFHVASIDRFTPYELAGYVLLKVLGLKGIVRRVSIADYLKNYPATFPQYSGLTTETTERTLGVKFSSWKSTVNRHVAELRELLMF